MSTPTTARKARQVKRTVKLTLRPFEDSPGVVRIQAGKVVTDYFLTRLACDYGFGFELEKILPPDGEDGRYHVHFDPAEDGHSCSCKGFVRWGHCKHADGLAALLKAGQLTA
jgi:hypothetical protein